MASTASRGLRVEDVGEGVRVLRLERPERRNALSKALLSELMDAYAAAEHDGVRVLRLEGSGGTFCSGFDFEGLVEYQEQAVLPGNEALPLPDAPLIALFARIEQCRIPTVAVVTGAAYGAGCELAAACDFRLGTEGASFRLPPVRLGVVYAPEGVARMIRVIGFARAKRMFLSGAVVDAGQALDWGLLESVAATEAQVQEAAAVLCRELVSGSENAITGTKALFTALAPNVLGADLQSGFEALRREAMLSDDTRRALEPYRQRLAASRGQK